MAGGGNILSKKALKKFATFISRNGTLCKAKKEAGDVMVGRCMKKFAIFVDARDSENQKQIFPAGVIVHMKHGEPDLKYWYFKYLYRNVTQGGLDCCSDIFIGVHYVKPKEMYLMDYLIYNVHPFGLRKNLTENLPRKLSLDEIIENSDKKSFAKNFVPHAAVHYIDDDEKY
jgi:glycoprotein-N-acetylgalactosamine 3-beta-galactosyltransferase